MTDELKNLKCEVCSIGVSQIAGEELTLAKAQIPEWEIIEDNNIKKLTRKFKLRDFKEVLSFLNKIGNIAEEEGHHPAMMVEYNRLTVWWWSHKIKGLHRNDFVMAAKTDDISVDV